MFHTRTLSEKHHECKRRAGYDRRILALAITLSALLFPTAELNSQEQTLEEVYEQSLEWLAKETGYVVPQYRPEVIYTTIEVINKLYYRTAYEGQGNVRALFTSLREIILLPRDPAIGFMENWGYAVHEHLHWLQFTNGAYESYKNWCSHWDEIEAYDFHLKWVKENLLPEEHIKSIEASLNSFKRKCDFWNAIVSGWRMWDLSGVYYCTTEEYARKIFNKAETVLDLLAGVVVQDVQHLFTLEVPLKIPCGIFRDSDVGLVTRLIESRLIDETGEIYRFAEVRVRNAADGGRFTRTLFAISPYEFKPLEVPGNN